MCCTSEIVGTQGLGVEVVVTVLVSICILCILVVARKTVVVKHWLLILVIVFNSLIIFVVVRRIVVVRHWLLLVVVSNGAVAI